MEETKLNKLANFLKREGPLIILLLLVFAIFSLFLISKLVKNNKNPNQASEKSLGVPFMSNIYPGNTTKQDLEKLLGQPKKIESKENLTVYYYPTSNQFRQNEIALSNNIVTVVKEQVISQGKNSLNRYTSEFGQPDAILSGPHGDFAPGHFWGKQGLLVFANEQDGVIVEIWYFKPIALDSFLNQFPQLSTQEVKKF